MTDYRIQEKIADYTKAGKKFAIVTITESAVGSPRKSGSKMLVFPDGSIDFTIGGGAFEVRAVKEALQAIKESRNRSFKMEFQADKSGMVCGGSAEVFIEVNVPSPSVIIFGGGHVALSLAELLRFLSITFVVADDRPEFSSKERFPEALSVYTVDYSKFSDAMDIPEGSYCVIITQGHKGDKAVLKQLLNTKAAYIGMIGSKNKVRTVSGEIEQETGSPCSEIVFAPIGLDLGGETPEEIAVSIVAEILKNKYNKSGNSLSIL